MPRLVSLTLLSVLLLPAAALWFFVVIVVGWEVFNYQSPLHDVTWPVAAGTTLVLTYGWWSLLWARDVAWTPGRVLATALITAGTLLVSAALGVFIALVANEPEIGWFTFALASCVLWLVGICVAWRTSRGKLADAGGGGEGVACPDCGYSLRGLTATRCPECGSQYTLDQLLAANRPRGDLA